MNDAGLLGFMFGFVVLCLGLLGMVLAGAEKVRDKWQSRRDRL